MNLIRQIKYGSLIKELRKARGMKQKELGELLLPHCKDNKVRINKYENDVIDPSDETLYKIFDLLDVDVNISVEESITDLRTGKTLLKGTDEMPMKPSVSNEESPLLADSIEYGQGDDADILEMLRSYQKFREGYYELMNIEPFWEVMNQSKTFNEEMQKAWDSMGDLMSCLDKMDMLLAGSYINFSKFIDGLSKSFDQGNGFRRKEKE